MMIIAAAPIKIMIDIPATAGRNISLIRKERMVENIRGRTVNNEYLMKTDESNRREFVQSPVRFAVTYPM